MKRSWCVIIGSGLTLLLASAANAQTPRPVYDVRIFGAKGDGESLDTQALQKTMDECSAAGGGVVYFSPGIYKAGTLHLRDNTTLYLDPGAELRQSKEMKDYAVTAKDCFVHITGSKYVFLHGHGVRNVTITGGGRINGNMALDEDGSRGPLTILFEHSKDILLENITVEYAPGWSIT
ncbi:MAG: hypothetical protein GXY44_01510, partial [Phycisphaerales bacterium]|nr:hypothetical protein [Phycisphaerales bacterium]